MKIKNQIGKFSETVINCVKYEWEILVMLNKLLQKNHKTAISLTRHLEKINTEREIGVVCHCIKCDEETHIKGINLIQY